VTLLIALLGAAVLLSGLVLLAGFRRRGHDPLESTTADASREAGRPAEASPSANNWMFGSV
jgi:hypothetical protein